MKPILTPGGSYPQRDDPLVFPPQANLGNAIGDGTTPSIVSDPLPQSVANPGAQTSFLYGYNTNGMWSRLGTDALGNLNVAGDARLSQQIAMLRASLAIASNPPGGFMPLEIASIGA